MTSNPYVSARSGSFAATIRTDSPEGCRIALLGLADDTGVAMNNGRPGAKDGPRAFREALSRYGGTHWVGRDLSECIDLRVIGVFDAGDVPPGASLEETHDRVTDRVRELLDLDLLPVCIGGGHDLTWPAVRAVAEQCPGMRGTYFDAHLDVREEAGSGMAFRKILTETTCDRLTIVGIDGFANRREHLKWFLANGGHVNDGASFDDPSEHADCFVSLDLDVLNVAHAPGVSATNPIGESAEVADRWARSSGNLESIRYFDIMELNPKYDIDGRTARLAARLFLSFIAGYAQRHG